MTGAATEADDWWESFFTDEIAELYLVRHDAAELDATMRFLTDVLAIAPGSTVFDQCCGIGSLSIAFAQRGVRAVGVDLCEPYVRRARHDARDLGAAVEVHVGDAFAFVPARPCDAAFNWYSSFGYARDDAKNLQMLARAFESLRPGGRFALDYPNFACVLREFQACMLRKGRTERGDVLIVRECAIDLRDGLLLQEWIHVGPGGRHASRRSAVRIYLPHQIAELFERAGFADVTLYGGLGREPIAASSPRCLCVGRRP